MQVAFQPFKEGKLVVDSKRYILSLTKHDNWGPFTLYPIINGMPLLDFIGDQYILED